MASITTSYKGNMLFETKIGNHAIVIDVPENMGGSDRGPMPPQLFVASLGSCIGAYVAQYCRNNSIDDTGMTVDVSFEKVDNPTRLINLKVTIRFPNGDCSARVDAIQRVAEHCPVHETIMTMKGIEVEILDKIGCQVRA